MRPFREPLLWGRSLSATANLGNGAIPSGTSLTLELGAHATMCKPRDIAPTDLMSSANCFKVGALDDRSSSAPGENGSSAADAGVSRIRDTLPQSAAVK